jgi:hypothetical protein
LAVFASDDELGLVHTIPEKLVVKFKPALSLAPGMFAWKHASSTFSSQRHVSKGLVDVDARGVPPRFIFAVFSSRLPIHGVSCVRVFRSRRLQRG